MREKAGHSFVAYAIWEIGLPHMPPFATEQWRSRPTEHQHDPQLSAEDLEAVAEAIDSVMEWLDRIAGVLLTHRTNDLFPC